MKIFKQETNKSCGVACLRSIFNYHRKTFSEKEIWEKNEVYKTSNGIINPIISLGITALKFGFKAEYIGYNPLIFKIGKKNLKESLQEKLKTYIEFGKFSVDKTLEFLELGGKVTIKKLTLKALKEIIDKNKFVIINLKPAFIWNTVSLGMNHKVIIEGYNKKGFKILNPSTEKSEVIDYDTFLLAFYAAIPELLIIKKK